MVVSRWDGRAVAASDTFLSVSHTHGLVAAERQGPQVQSRCPIRHLSRHRAFNRRTQNMVSSGEKTVSIVFRAAAGAGRQPFNAAERARPRHAGPVSLTVLRAARSAPGGSRAS